MLITNEILAQYKASNKLFGGRNLSNEAREVLSEQKYRIEKEYEIFCLIRLKMLKLFIFYIII